MPKKIRLVSLVFAVVVFATLGFAHISIAEATNASEPRIVFTSDRTGNPDIFIMNSDGSGQTNISNNPSEDTMPQWTASRRILFLSERAETRQVFIMDADGSNVTQLTFDNNRYYIIPFVSPDGKKAIVQSSLQDGIIDQVETKLVDLESSQVSNLADDLAGLMGVGVSWKPDSSEIIFSAQKDTDPITLGIYRTGLSPQSVPVLIDIVSGDPEPALKLFPVYSPDGTKIMYTGNNSDTDYYFYILEVDSGLNKRLNQLAIFEQGVTFPGPMVWSPDSTRFTFSLVEEDGVTAEVSIVDIAQESVTNISNFGAGYISYAFWYGSSLYNSNSSKMIMNTNVDGNGEIYIMEDDGSNKINLTNNPAEDIIGFAASEIIPTTTPPAVVAPNPPKTGKLIGATIISASLIATTFLFAKEARDLRHVRSRRK